MGGKIVNRKSVTDSYMTTLSKKKLLEIPRGPRGLDFVFLDPRRMLNCLSSIPRFLEE